MQDSAIGKGLCYTEFLGQAYLWDDNLDGGKRSARAESDQARESRRDTAANICGRCPERLTCEFKLTPGTTSRRRDA